ncbi:hypothetical protein ZBT109_1451 [Zymobacter palmae]|uniref:Uncharacterized protein n=1 Tax=Zymobacter palmae TaxID=33074 RepID=A0A348HF09_9GAMM|nr:hypothetical protein ZBT109_1451 [Zymobacter palmae]
MRFAFFIISHMLGWCGYALHDYHDTYRCHVTSPLYALRFLWL